MVMSLLKKSAIFLLVALILVPQAKAIPSGGVMPPVFKYRSGFWYDDFGLTRNDAFGTDGTDGYLPRMQSETIGVDKELAYSIGERFKDMYSDRNALAAAILKYVQTWTEYGYDSDNVIMGGVSQDEWAWNADEMAHNINEATGALAVGDCEDLAFLCATIYVGAGFETAIIDAPQHCALLIWLPDFQNANQYWELSEDNRGAGWIWVEATGSSNPLGWTPPDFFDGDWTAYTLVDGVYHPQQPVSSNSSSSGFDDLDLIFAIVFIILIIVSRMFRR
jgi:hypothetical protein